MAHFETIFPGNCHSLSLCVTYIIEAPPLSSQAFDLTFVIIIMIIYNSLNDALSTYRLHKKLKTILSKNVHVENRQS